MPISGRLRVTSAVLDLVRSASEAAYPMEACGLLVGRPGEGATSAVSLTNAAAERRTSFEMLPSELASVGLDARDRGLDLVGSWHSHPDREAVPSAADHAAAQLGWSHVVVGVQGGDRPRAGMPRCWRLVGGEMIEHAMEIG